MSRAPARSLRAASAALLAAACAAPRPLPSAPPHAANHPERKTFPEDAVEQARAPFHALRVSDRTTLASAAFLEEVATADVLCLGERHDEPVDHFIQLVVLELLVERATQTGRQLAVGLEMISRERQASLDRFASALTDEKAFLLESEWDRRWGYDFSLYRPLLVEARRAGLPLLALNASPDLVHRVARSGIAGLGPEDQRALPEMAMDGPDHRALFDAAMREHPASGASMDSMYEAQVLWDESMAETAAEWLEGGTAARQLLILAGSGHCHETGIVRRVERRAPVRAVAVRTASTSDPAAVPHGPAASEARVDYLVLVEHSSTGAP